MRVLPRRPHTVLLALATSAVLPVAAVPAASATTARPHLAVSAQAAEAKLTVRVRATASGTATIAVKRGGSTTVGKATTKLTRGKLRTLSFKISGCKACTKIDVVGTLKAPGAKAVTETVAVSLTTTTSAAATSTTTTTSAGAAPAAPKPAAPVTATTVSSTTTTGGAPKTPAAGTAPTATAPTTVTAPSSTVNGTPATAAPTATEGIAATKLTWAPPTLTSPTTIKVTDANRNLKLDSTKDYIISMPSTPLTGGYGLVVNGGRNVVLIGGEINIPWQGATPPVNSRRGLYLLNQTGTVHIEGLWIHGDDLSEGINLDERGAHSVVQIQNVRIDGVHARDEAGFTDNHPDLIQTWGGPNILRVDRLTGSSDYQGFFLAPMQFGTIVPTLFDLRNIDISAVKRNNVFFAGYLLWQASPFPMNIKNMFVVADAKKTLPGSQFPKTGVWTAAQAGTPTGGSFVTTTSSGVSYSSAGYAAS